MLSAGLFHFCHHPEASSFSSESQDQPAAVGVGREGDEEVEFSDDEQVS